MQKYGVIVAFRHPDGNEGTFLIGPEELDDLGVHADTQGIDAIGIHTIEETLRRRFVASGADWPGPDIKVYLSDGAAWDDALPFAARLRKPAASGDPDPAVRRVLRCRSLLRLANLALPPSAREDALDEWMDEIQSAVEEGLPFRRRALSILCRSLPMLALRARFPVRARRGEG